MNKLIPIFASIALAILFFLLPATPEILFCKTCSSSSPYLPLIGTGYFTLLGTLWLLFPKLPSPLLAKGGLLWSVLLAGSLTYVKWPVLCWFCLIAHACHILIWMIWVFAARAENLTDNSNRRERACLLVFAPLCMVAVFASLNLTFVTYGFKVEQAMFSGGLHIGDAIPQFETMTVAGKSFCSSDVKESERTVINFMSPDCPYCKEQKPIVQDVFSQLPEGSYRFVNVSSVCSHELVESASYCEWVEDKGEKLLELFKIEVYPTLFVVDNNGTIRQVFTGVPDQLHSDLKAAFGKSKL